MATYYGPQAWTEGTFSVSTPVQTSAAGYAYVNYLENIKTTNAAGPNGERVIDAFSSTTYDTSALDEENFGPSSGFFDARGSNDGTGVFYKGDVKLSSAAQADIGNFSYPFNVGKDSLLRTFWQLRVALTEGKVYIWVKGDGEVDTGATISADNSWKTFKVQIVPSSDEGFTGDGIVRVWMKASTDPDASFVLLYSTTTSFAWVNTNATAYMLNYVAYGHFGVLPATNWTIYTSAPQKRGTMVVGENTTVTASRAVAFGLDGNTNVHSDEGVLKIFGDLVVTGTTTLTGNVTAAAPTTLMNSIVTTGTEIVFDGSGNVVYVDGS